MQVPFSSCPADSAYPSSTTKRQCVAFPGDNARTGTSHKTSLLVLQSGWLKTHLCLKNPRQPFGPTILTQRLKTKSTRSLLAYESAR